MQIRKTIKENAQTLIALGTVVGMAIGILNFFILTSITPIEKRVEALETSIKGYMPLELSIEKWKNNDENHKTIEKKLDYLIMRVDQLIK